MKRRFTSPVRARSRNCLRDRLRRGFTLIELLVVLAIMGLVASIMVVNADSFLKGLGEPPLSELLRKSIREGRYYAALEKRPTSLHFDEDEGAFIIQDETGKELTRIETELPREEVGVEFFLLPPARGLNLEFGSREPIESIHFHPDRSSTPFEARLRSGDDVSTHRYDPFSDIEIVQN